MMNNIAGLISGNVFKDYRGTLRFFNTLSLLPVKRFYIITHENETIVRAWQGHKVESKWFYVLKGAFDFVLFQPDSWDKPSSNQSLNKFTIHANDNKILYVPGGYVNGFKALSPDSEVMVFSDATLEDSSKDNYRYDATLWYKW